MNKDVEQHLDELIEYYSKCDFDDEEYLKKLIVRNLKDVKRRYIKYDKPVKEELEAVKEKINQIKKELENNDEWLLNILEGSDKE